MASFTAWQAFISIIVLISIRSGHGTDLSELEEHSGLNIEPGQLLLGGVGGPPTPPSSSSLVGSEGLSSLTEKRSWQNLQGSWGKRDYQPLDDYDIGGQQSWQTTNLDDTEEYEDGKLSKFGNYYRNQQQLQQQQQQPEQQQQQQQQQQPQQQQQFFTNEQKRAWKAMNGAWGKRLGNTNSANGDWNRFRGSWGKREPGWNNLKGLWGKRAANWNKLQSAWGKRDLY